VVVGGAPDGGGAAGVGAAAGVGGRLRSLAVWSQEQPSSGRVITAGTMDLDRDGAAAGVRGAMAIGAVLPG
jgi:hypothetical protein